MGTPWAAEPGVDMVLAAQRGDRRALDGLVTAYLPLVYNIVGRAMNGHPDVDDVVQETMLRVVRGIRDLRGPEAFRSWLVAIAIRQVRDSYRARMPQEPVADVPEASSPDFADLTVTELGLSGQRREVAEATRWLDSDDGPVLALWWQEATGILSRAELAEALGMPPAHAAVRVARMKERLTTSRMIVRAMHQSPSCGGLATLAAGWDGNPSPLWRKRFARHIRECGYCLPRSEELVEAERLLHGLALVPVPVALAGLLAHSAAGAHHAVSRGARHVRHALPKAATLSPKAAVISLAVVVCAAGGALAAARGHHAAPTALSLPSAPAPKPTTAPATHPDTHRAPRPRSFASPAQKTTPMAVTTARKGVCTWKFTGTGTALRRSGASWYYDWGPAPVTSSRASFVPMIWGAGSVTTATLKQVEREGHILLGFNEPNMTSQSNISVAEALNLWPRLEATGMTLGSPAVAYGAATPGGWLDQFMKGAKARGYRVDFITVHWYGGDFRTAQAVRELQSYLQAIYDRYHLPIWLTEFALTNYSGPHPTFPTEAGQAAFLTAATKMLDGLSYIQRYAWFALPVSSGTGTTGLFTSSGAATPVGRAFESAS
jgi:RNA polymerase sigma factor (sigma-70 family)